MNTTNQMQFKNQFLENYNSKEILNLIHLVLQAIDQKNNLGINHKTEIEELFNNFIKTNNKKDINSFLKEFIEFYGQHCIGFNPHSWLAHMQSGLTTKGGLIGYLLGAIGHENMVAADDSPIGKVLEKKTSELLLKLIGHKKSSINYKKAIALLLSGGTEANQLGLIIGRNKVIYENCGINISENGLIGLSKNIQPVILAPNSVHYSFKKIANITGIGIKNIIGIETKNFRTDPKDLERKLRNIKGKLPISIISVFGTTETGAIDEIDKIEEIIGNYKYKTNKSIWWHLDGAYGGPALLLDKFKKYQKSALNADSLTIDPHKLLRVLHQAGAIILKNALDLRHISTDAPYIGNQIDNLNNKEFVGQMRDHLGAVKLVGSQSAGGVYGSYLTIKTLGFSQIKKSITKTINTANYFKNQLSKLKPSKGKIEIINDQNDLNIIVWKYSSNINNKSIDNEINKKVFNKLLYGKDSECVISRTNINGIDMNRIVIINPLTGKKDIDNILENYLNTLNKIINETNG